MTELGFQGPSEAFASWGTDFFKKYFWKEANCDCCHGKAWILVTLQQSLEEISPRHKRGRSDGIKELSGFIFDIPQLERQLMGAVTPLSKAAVPGVADPPWEKPAPVPMPVWVTGLDFSLAHYSPEKASFTLGRNRCYWGDDEGVSNPRKLKRL